MQQQPNPFILNLPPNTILQQIRITTQDSQITIQPILSHTFNKGDIVKVKNGQIGIFESCTAEQITLKICVTPKGNIKLNKTYSAFEVRLANKEEIDFFFNTLKANKMSFDFEKFEIIDSKYYPKLGDIYYTVQVLNNYKIIPVELEWCNDWNDHKLLNKNLVFKSVEEASKFIKNLCINTK